MALERPLPCTITLRYINFSRCLWSGHMWKLFPFLFSSFSHFIFYLLWLKHINIQLSARRWQQQHCLVHTLSYHKQQIIVLYLFWRGCLSYFQRIDIFISPKKKRVFLLLSIETKFRFCMWFLKPILKAVSTALANLGLLAMRHELILEFPEVHSTVYHIELV